MGGYNDCSIRVNQNLYFFVLTIEREIYIELEKEQEQLAN